jgi:hypothetical protein
MLWNAKLRADTHSILLNGRGSGRAAIRFGGANIKYLAGFDCEASGTGANVKLADISGFSVE